MTDKTTASIDLAQLDRNQVLELMLKHDMLTQIGYRALLDGESMDADLNFLTRLVDIARRSLTSGAPAAWIQYIDGVKTQNVARDQVEKDQIEGIARIMNPTATTTWEALYAAPVHDAAAPSAEQAQWRNIRKAIQQVAEFCFGGPEQEGNVSMAAAYISVVNCLTAKDGADLKLEPLSAGAAAKSEQAPDCRSDRDAWKALVGKAVDVLRRHLPPDGISSDAALNELYGIFDGPDYHNIADLAQERCDDRQRQAMREAAQVSMMSATAAGAGSAQPGAEGDERALFEAKYRTMVSDPDAPHVLARDESGLYESGIACGMWTIWQARAALDQAAQSATTASASPEHATQLATQDHATLAAPLAHQDASQALLDEDALNTALAGMLEPSGWAKYHNEGEIAFNAEDIKIIFKAGQDAALARAPLPAQGESVDKAAGAHQAIQFALELAEHENDDAAVSFLTAWSTEDIGYLRSNWPDFDAAMRANDSAAEGGQS